jgi:hypothetical protein
MIRRYTLFMLLVCAAPVSAQDSLLPHPDDSRWWLSGQVNFIFQWHGDFTSPYEGPNSLRAESEDALSHLLTLYTGVRLGSRTDVIFDVESAGGRGISDALGLAGFTDLDVVRNPTLGSAPYVARLFVHQTIPLGSDTMHVDRGPFSLASEVPVRRIDVRAGKFGTVDWFDLNGPGSDSHTQFMNWTADNNGAYDYAADTRGYSNGIEAEYTDRWWSLRFAEMMMPKVANGIDLDWNIAKARAENLELEVRHNDGVVRVLSYLNHANMGSYAEALAAWHAGVDPRPTIELHRQPGRTKQGFAVNAEQSITHDARVFGRWGWNEGHHESFAYTEANGAIELGADVRGAAWSRANDKAGVAVMINSLSDDHAAYLAAGGLGFILGDGHLTYGTERIVEAYYTARLYRGVFASFDVQGIVNPGYNRDRGPVLVPGIRLHLEF